MQLARLKTTAALALCVGTLALVGGCATMAGGGKGPPSYDDHMADGAAALEQGQPARALQAFERAAALAPASKEPWLVTARVRTTSGQPVRALSAAQEVLARDPADAEAHELFIHNSLVLAERAASRLDRGEPAAASAHLAQARSIVDHLTAVFGLDVLPEAALVEYADQVLSAYKAQRPGKKAEEARKSADPLDVLGGD